MNMHVRTTLHYSRHSCSFAYGSDFRIINEPRVRQEGEVTHWQLSLDIGSGQREVGIIIIIQNAVICTWLSLKVKAKGIEGQICGVRIIYIVMSVGLNTNDSPHPTHFSPSSFTHIHCPILHFYYPPFSLLQQRCSLSLPFAISF